MKTVCQELFSSFFKLFSTRHLHSPLSRTAWLEYHTTPALSTPFFDFFQSFFSSPFAPYYIYGYIWKSHNSAASYIRAKSSKKRKNALFARHYLTNRAQLHPIRSVMAEISCSLPRPFSAEKGTSISPSLNSSVSRMR